MPARHFPTLAPSFPALSAACTCSHCRTRADGWLTAWIAVMARRLNVPIARALRVDGLSLLHAIATENTHA